MLKYMLSNLLDIGISMYDFLLRIANAHYQVVANLNKIGGGSRVHHRLNAVQLIKFLVVKPVSLNLNF